MDPSLSAESNDLSNLSNEDLTELVRELRSRCVELEAQNEELRVRETRLRQLIDRMAGGVWAIDKEGVTTFVSGRTAAFLGRSCEEIVGTRLETHVDSDHRGLVQELLSRAQNGVVAHQTVDFLRNDGAPWRVRFSVSPLYNHQGEWSGSAAVIRDARRQSVYEEELAESEYRFRTLAESSFEGICLSEYGVIRDCNDQLVSMLGYTRDDVIGRRFTELVPREYHEKLLGNRAQSPDHPYEQEMLRKDGSRCVVEIRERTIRNRGRPLRIGVFREITERKQAEIQLRESEFRLRQAMQIGNCYYFEWNAVTDQVTRSPEAAAVLGQTVEEVLVDSGRDYLQRIAPTDRVRFLDVLARLTPQSDSYVFDYRITRGDGGIRHFEEMARGFFDQDGKLLRLLGIVADATERKQSENALRESEAQFRELAEAMPQIVFVADSAGRGTYMNRRWSEYTGHQPGQDVIDLWAESIHPEDRPGVQFQWNTSLRDSTPYSAIYRLRNRDGAYRWHMARGIPIKNDAGQVIHWYGTSTDIDETKRAVEHLQEADRKKNEFIAILAHELRNPLAPIRNAVQILRLTNPTDPRVVWSRDVIDRQVQQMARLLEDLLDVSRITRSNLEVRREPVIFANIVQLALETCRPLIERGAHELRVNLPAEPVLLDADPVRLAQVLGNLLNNAAKYTDRGGVIQLTAESNDREVVVSVKDNGFGIAPEILPHLFEMFTQVSPSTQRSQGGLGIGLSLARGLVELHGGTLEARSDGLGKGSEFIVRLPAAIRRHAPISPVASAWNSPTTGCRILLADDNVDIAKSLAMMLELFGHEVHVAMDGRQALEAVAQFLPDAALLDIGMPWLSGHEVARRIRQQAWGRNMLLIALTGWGQEEDQRRSSESGFDAHLIKPVDPEVLENLLQQRIQRSKP